MAANKLQIGNVEILDLTDAGGPFAPLSEVFPGVTADQWAPYRERYPAAFSGDFCNIHFGGFLVRSRGQMLLVDTGIGPNPPEALFGTMTGRLPQELEANGVAPESIDLVFITHVHPDHVGWNLTESGSPRFPRARYLMHEKDWAILPKFRELMPPFIDQTLTPLQTLGVLELLSGEKALTEEVVALPAPGHTPGHMVLLINSGGERAIILGDALVHPAHISEPDWVFGFDFDAELAAATRRQLIDRAETESMTMVQCHLPSPGYGRVIRVEGRRFWQAL
jgi:glyoxylase-like metal-dependent hydrolase (beta-lactamase superfamily II)